MTFHLKQTIKSTIDNTVKFIYQSDKNETAEVSYINKQDGKDILCVPTQTNCRMGCKFCHLTGLDIQVRSFSGLDIYLLVQDAVHNLELPRDNKTLLISYMGSGEPLANIDGVIHSAELIFDQYSSHCDIVRFAVASIIPSEKLMRRFTGLAKASGLDVKFHLSLHYGFEYGVRENMMPSALGVERSCQLVHDYALETGNRVEAHYTLMEGLNDQFADSWRLADLSYKYKIPVKVLHFSERAGVDLRQSTREKEFVEHLRSLGCQVEYYDPPGRDVGSSCGMFLVDHYK